MEGHDYGNFLQKFLYKYMLDNSLVPDDIFLEEIAVSIFRIYNDTF